MKKLFLIPIAALVFAVPANAGHGSTVKVIMKDPGCHWFSVHGKILKSKSLTKRGPVTLINYDEKALIIKSKHGTKHEQVGAKMRLSHGKYTITMVKQMKHDNTLHLTVK
jgi:hypothetical protein